MLIIFGGLPGTGKTTLARALASALRAAYLRIDTIQHAIAEDISIGEKSREFEPWNAEIVIDTARRSVEECLAELREAMRCA